MVRTMSDEQKRYFIDTEYGRIHWIKGDTYSGTLVGFNKKELQEKIKNMTHACFDIGKSRLCEINIGDLHRVCRKELE